MAKINTTTSVQEIVSRLNAKSAGHNEWRCACPVHGGRDKTAFSISEASDGTPLFYCFSGCTRDAITSWMMQEGFSSGRVGAASRTEKPIPFTEWRGLPLVKTYKYNGGFVGRYEGLDENGEHQKAIIPFFKNGGKAAGFPDHENYLRPLYGRTDSKEIVIVEGEKCADCLLDLGIAAVTWAGGASAVKKSDWSKIQNCNVYIWPDNDTPGKNAAQDVFEILSVHNTCHICKVPEILAEGEDCFDYLEKLGRPGNAQDIWGVLKHGMRQVKTLSLPDYLRLQTPPREFVLGWLQARSINMVYAWTGIGKSWFSLGVAYALSVGGAFLKWEASREAKVFYIDGEMGTAEMQSRLVQLAEQHGGIVSENFRLTDPDLNDGIIPKINTPEGRALIDEQILAHESEFIFVDNISMLVGGEENEATTWEPIQDWAVKHKSQGRSVIFVHHANKSGGQRGTSKQQDALNCLIVLQDPGFSPDETNLPRKACFEVHFEKGREDFDKTPFIAWVEESPGDKGNLSIKREWQHCPLTEFKKQRVFNLQRSGYSLREIQKITGCSKSSIQRWVREAAENEQENFENENTGGDRYNAEH